MSLHLIDMNPAERVQPNQHEYRKMVALSKGKNVHIDFNHRRYALSNSTISAVFSIIKEGIYFV